MRKINEKDYVSFTISAAGWSCTVYTLKGALKEWNNIESGILYGNKPNGDRSIIDQK